MRRLLWTLIIFGLAAPAWAQLTPNPVAGVTVISNDPVRRVMLKETVAFGAFTCNATTCDVTIATIPAKTRVVSVIADLTATFVCAATCTTSTLSFTTGKTAGGNEYLVSIDADAATATKGLANADLGATLATSATTPILGGDVPSWSAATTLQMRMTSGTGVVGSGTVTNFNAGSITFYITVEQFP